MRNYDEAALTNKDEAALTNNGFNFFRNVDLICSGILNKLSMENVLKVLIIYV